MSTWADAVAAGPQIARGTLPLAIAILFAPMLRIGEMPAVDVHIVPSELPPTGVGDPGVSPVAPALANALFKLSGKRVRRLPIRAADLR